MAKQEKHKPFSKWSTQLDRARALIPRPCRLQVHSPQSSRSELRKQTRSSLGFCVNAAHLRPVRPTDRPCGRGTDGRAVKNGPSTPSPPRSPSDGWIDTFPMVYRGQLREKIRDTVCSFPNMCPPCNIVTLNAYFHIFRRPACLSNL